jgi:hypothetical protein
LVNVQMVDDLHMLDCEPWPKLVIGTRAPVGERDGENGSATEKGVSSTSPLPPLTLSLSESLQHLSNQHLSDLA